LDKVWQNAVIDGLYRLWGFPVLIQSEAEEMTEFRLYAHKTLVKRTGKDFGRDVEAWEEWWDEYDE
jgi:hypothetical protein